MARGLAAVADPADLTIIVNVGDDDVMYGLNVSPDLDTVTYTLAGVEGPYGWGLRDDSFVVMDRLAELDVDTTFRLGDRDLATCLERTNAYRRGGSLASFTSRMTASLGIAHTVLPVTDDRVRTRVQVSDGSWLDFQDYFVKRHHADQVRSLAFRGAERALPADGVLEAIEAASAVVIAPSNPPLSIWPILAMDSVKRAIEAKDIVVAVSPLFAGRALKGPAATVMADLGLPPGNAGVLAAYNGLVTHLVVDRVDSGDVTTLESDNLTIVATDTRIGDVVSGARLATQILAIIGDTAASSPVR
jgi:LPPG:FO 2-phospho-L-lactate transferase